MFIKLCNTWLANGTNDYTIYYVYANFYECSKYHIINIICICIRYDIEGVAYASIIAQIYGCIVGFLAIYFKAKLNITKE